MKIAYIINQYPKVSHSFIRREILALEKQGMSVKRYSVRDPGKELVDKRDIEEYQNTTFLLNSKFNVIIEALILGFVKKPISFFKLLIKACQYGIKSEAGIIKHVIYFVEALVLARLLKQEEVQHLHAHFGTNSTTVAMLACKYINIPFSFTVHGPEEFDKPAFISLPEKIKQAAFIVAISSFGRSQLYRLVPNNQWQKIKIVHCGLEPEFFNEYKKTENNTNNIVCIGRLCEQKGQILIVEALNLLKMKNIDFHLTLVGDGEMRADIEEKINQYKLNEQVSITGWMSSDRVKEEILKAKFTILPSFAEGLPVVIMESMSLEVPVLSTFIAGIPELIKHEENGWLVAAGDVTGLATALENALKMDSKQIALLGKKARISAIERHNIDNEALKLSHHFKVAINGTIDNELLISGDSL
jgi:colanic acid/amylovoran biosynthesis glycosyltransferase